VKKRIYLSSGFFLA